MGEKILIFLALTPETKDVFCKNFPKDQSSQHTSYTNKFIQKHTSTTPLTCGRKYRMQMQGKRQRDIERDTHKGKEEGKKREKRDHSHKNKTFIPPEF